MEVEVKQQWMNVLDPVRLNPDFDNCDKEIDEDGVMSGNMIVLSAMMDIVNTGSNKLYEEVCKKWGVEVNG